MIRPWCSAVNLITALFQTELPYSTSYNSTLEIYLYFCIWNILDRLYFSKFLLVSVERSFEEINNIYFQKVFISQLGPDN